MFLLITLIFYLNLSMLLILLLLQIVILYLNVLLDILLLKHLILIIDILNIVLLLYLGFFNVGMFNYAFFLIYIAIFYNMNKYYIKKLSKNLIYFLIYQNS